MKHILLAAVFAISLAHLVKETLCRTPLFPDAVPDSLTYNTQPVQCLRQGIEDNCPTEYQCETRFPAETMSYGTCVPRELISISASTIEPRGWPIQYHRDCEIKGPPCPEGQHCEAQHAGHGYGLCMGFKHCHTEDADACNEDEYCDQKPGAEYGMCILNCNKSVN